MPSILAASVTERPRASRQSRRIERVVAQGRGGQDRFTIRPGRKEQIVLIYIACVNAAGEFVEDGGHDSPFR